MMASLLPAVLYGTYALAIAYPLVELVLLAARSAAKGDPAREERARLLESGTKAVARGIVCLFACFVLAVYGAAVPESRPGEVGPDAARLMRALPWMFYGFAAAAAAAGARLLSVGVARLRVLPRADAGER